AILPFGFVASPGRAATVPDNSGACAEAGSGFRLPRRVPVQSLPRAISPGDFNKDGITDLAVLDSDDSGVSNISILLGNGQAAFAPVAGLSLDNSSFPYGGTVSNIVVADFNNDQKQDLAVAGTGGGVAVFPGRGDGSFAGSVSYLSGISAVAIAAGDFNSDGKTDLAVSGNNKLTILSGTGSGSFTEAAGYNVGNGVGVVTSADFNGDGKTDLAVVGSFGSSVVPYLNNGSGSFTAGTSFDARATVASVAAGDFNGDSKTDLAFGSQSGGVTLSQGDGAGGFNNAVTVGRNGSSVIAADFNNDGRADLAASVSDGEGSVAVLTGYVAGGFNSAVNYGAGKFPQALAAGDFNGDGRTDLAAANRDSGDVSILVNSGAGGSGGHFQAALVVGAGSALNSIRAGDLNKDSRPDLITTGFFSGYSIALGNSQGGFAPAQTFSLSGDAYASAAGDFNKDGNPDLAILSISSFGSGTITVLRGNGDGSFNQALTKTFTAGSRSVDLIAADLNGDGNADLATANPASNDVSILAGDGKGGFSAAVSFPVGPEPRSIVVADFNGDGKPDLATANRNSAAISVLIGDGAGGFNATLVGIGANPRTLITGDFNNDGKTDLAVPHNNDGNISILSGIGNGSFMAPVNFAVGGNPFAAVAGDFNGDGKTDLAVTRYVRAESTEFPENKVLLFAGNGSGGFSGAGEMFVPSAAHLLADDLNGDGLPDLAVSSRGSVWIAYGSCNIVQTGVVASVSAASYRDVALAPETIAAAFGVGLSTQTVTAST